MGYPGMDLEKMARPLPPVRGAIVTVNCTTTPTIIDLTTFPRSPAADPNSANPDQQNVIGHWVRITADGGSVYYAFGNNTAQLNTLSATSYSTINATTGAITVTNNESDVITNGRYKEFLVAPAGTMQAQNPAGSGSKCRYLAVFATQANTVARMHQRSA